MKAKVVCGFPGIGKSTLVQNNSNVIDLDSSDYSKSKYFPLNYMQAIIDADEKGYEYILVSTHESVRKILRAFDISYTLVYPVVDLCDEYIERYKERGSSESFINSLEENWDDYIFELQYDESEYIELDHGEFLSDVFNKI